MQAMVSITGERLCQTMHEIAAHAKQAIGKKPIEHFMVYLIGRDGTCVGSELIATGTETEVAPDFDKILEAYQAHDALAFVACHNHPGGYAMPSMQDVMVTALWLDAGREIGFNLLDSIVVADEQVTSIRSMFNGLAWPGC